MKHSQRRDLGASLYRLLQTVLAAERPILAAHGLEMWDYSVLTALGEGPAPTQAELAVQVGRDKTRLIPILDRLGQQGLVVRTPDPDDRRNRIVELTPAGRERLGACRADIRAMEQRLFAAAGQDPDVVLQGLERLVARGDNER